MKLLIAFIATVKAYSAGYSITGIKKGSAAVRTAYDIFYNTYEVVTVALNPTPTYLGFIPTLSSVLTVAALA